MRIAALAVAISGCVLMFAVAVYSPCDGGFWEGFKLASGVRCR